MEDEQRATLMSALLGILVPSIMGLIVTELLNTVKDTAASNVGKETTSSLQKTVDKMTEQGIDALLSDITKHGKFPAIVIDEANLGLPAGEEGKEEAKRVLAWRLRKCWGSPPEWKGVTGTEEWANHC